MGSKTYNVAWWWTATVTTNSDWSRSISFSNDVWWWYGWSTITGSAWGSSVTRTNSNGTTQTWTISWSWKWTSISWADTPSNWGGWSNNNNNNNNNPWFTPVSQVDFGGLSFWQGTSDSDQGSRNDLLGRYYAGREWVTADTIKSDLMQNTNFANASAADQQNTINRIMNLQNQYRNSWGGWVWGELNELGDKIQNPYQQQFQNDYSWQFANITNYINSLSWDLSWMRDLMEKNNTMFLSKLDAQMTQQKAMEERFNAEWSKIEWQMDENTKAQKARLDQMEQKYNENLQQMQDMLTDYYTWTMDALEAKAAWESAAAASDLSAKGLNSAVVANTTAGLDKNYREQFNALMKNNIELWQQLNNDYADFMNALVNQHNTLDQNQIRTLTEGLQMKQQYRQQETDLVNSYIDNVYKPMENHISKLAETYTDRADAAYKNERAVAEYKWMSTAARTRDIMNRLMAMVWDGNLETLSEQDLNLVSQIAARSDINSTEEAIAVLLKAAQRSGNSDIINAVSTAQRNWTWNVNPGSTNPGGTSNPGWNGTGWTETITEEETTAEEWVEWENWTDKVWYDIDLSKVNIDNLIEWVKAQWWTNPQIQIWYADLIKKLEGDYKKIQWLPNSNEKYKLLTTYRWAIEKVQKAKKVAEDDLLNWTNKDNYIPNNIGNAYNPLTLKSLAWDVDTIMNKTTWGNDKKYKKLNSNYETLIKKANYIKQYADTQTWWNKDTAMQWYNETMAVANKYKEAMWQF